MTGAFALSRALTDPKIGDDVVARIDLESPAEVIVDCMMLGAAARLNRERIAYSTIFHTLFEFWNGRFRYGPAGLASRARGLGDPREIWARSRRIVCADATLDARSRTEKDIAWVGAVHGVKAVATPPVRPRVLVSLSTVGYPGMTKVLQRIMNACAGVDADVVVTTGPAIDPSHLDLPSNATIHRFVDHGAIMPTCTAVVGHGGHSTTMRALAHGLPVLVIPMHPLIDQPVVGAATEAVGAGLTVPRSANAARIRAAIHQLINDTPLRCAANEIGGRLRAQNAAETAAYLATSKPVRSPTPGEP